MVFTSVGVPDMVIKPMQRLQNMCAKLVLGLNKCDSATEALHTLHWLPIRARIEYKVICICHQCIHGNAPEYLKCLLQKVIIAPFTRVFSLKLGRPNLLIVANLRR